MAETSSPDASTQISRSGDSSDWLTSKIDVEHPSEKEKKEAKWIKENIKQRKCIKPTSSDSECLCGLSKHAGESKNTARGWSVRTNTEEDTIDNQYYGVIDPKINGSSPYKFLRIDVMTKMPTIEKLLLKFWKLRKPRWIISFMGDTYQGKEKYEKERFRCLVRTALERLSICGGLWVTCDGSNSGLSNLIGKAIQKYNTGIDQVYRVTSVGINAWGLYHKKIIRKEPIHRSKSKHEPSSYFKHHLMVDDGSYNNEYFLKSVQNFKINLEVSLTRHTEDSQSIPLVSVLYGGTKYIIDGVLKAVDKKIPVIVIKDSGGYADVFAQILEPEESNTDKTDTSSLGYDTVIDDDLRCKVKTALKDSFEEEITATEVDEHIYKILKCTQKKNLFTVLKIKDQNELLAYTIIEALLNTMTQPEVFRLLDYYLPYHTFDGDGISEAEVFSAKYSKGFKATMTLFLRKAIVMDQAEVVDFIIDHGGINMTELLPEKLTVKDFLAGAGKTADDEKADTVEVFRKCSEWALDKEKENCAVLIWKNGNGKMVDDEEAKIEEVFRKCSEWAPDKEKEKCAVLFRKNGNGNTADDEEVFRKFLDWALDNEKEKCAVLFWKKGNELLASAMNASQKLKLKAKCGKQSITVKRKFEEQAELFDKIAMGMIDVCFEHDEDKTMDLIQTQTTKNKRNKDLLRHSLIEGDTEIFGTDAYKEYMNRVWFGKIKPPLVGEESPRKATGNEPKKHEEPCEFLERIIFAPVTKFFIHLLFFLVFLGIFGHTLLFAIRSSVSVWEIILTIWWFGLVIEEIRQFHISKVRPGVDELCCNSKLCSKFQRYLVHNPWNILDCICLVMFFIGAVFVIAYHLSPSATSVLDTARVILSIDMMLFIWRIIQYLTIFNIMGSVFEMIVQTVKVLVPFLVIMAVFILAQGVATYALLYPVTDWSGNIFIDIPKNAFWNIFGELFLDDIEATDKMNQCSTNPITVNSGSMNRCPSNVGSYLVPFLLAVHMIITNVIILNLLIARFTFTFEKMHEKSEYIAAWQRAKVTLEFCRKPLAPPPLNILYHIFDLIRKRYCGNQENQVKDGNPRKQKETTLNNPDKYLDSWERKMGEHYLVTHEIKHGNKKISILKESKDNDQLIVQGSREHQQLIRLICDMDSRLQDTQADVEGLKVGKQAKSST